MPSFLVIHLTFHVQVSSHLPITFLPTLLYNFPGKYNINLLVMAIDNTNIDRSVFCISSLGWKKHHMYHWPLNMYKSKLEMSYIMGLALHKFRGQWYMWGFSCPSTISKITNHRYHNHYHNNNHSRLNTYYHRQQW